MLSPHLGPLMRRQHHEPPALAAQRVQQPPHLARRTQVQRKRAHDHIVLGAAPPGRHFQSAGLDVAERLRPAGPPACARRVEGGREWVVRRDEEPVGGPPQGEPVRGGEGGFAGARCEVEEAVVGLGWVDCGRWVVMLVMEAQVEVVGRGVEDGRGRTCLGLLIRGFGGVLFGRRVRGGSCRCLRRGCSSCRRRGWCMRRGRRRTFLGAGGGEDVSRFGVWGLRVEIGGLRFCDRGLVGGCRQAMIDRPLPPQARAETVLVLCLA